MPRIVQRKLAGHSDSIHGWQIARWGGRKGRITIVLSLSFGALGIQEHRSMRCHDVLMVVVGPRIGFGRIQGWVVL